MSGLDEAFRDHWGRLIALLVAQFLDLDVAEEAVADAYEAAARDWGDDPPHNPGAWLLTVARRKALDRLRGSDTARRKLPLLLTDEVAPDAVIDPLDRADDEVRLILLTCHPSLGADAQAALALRLVVGLSTGDIARVFLVSEATMAARITRAKKKLALAGVPFSLPSADAVSSRLDAAVATIYLAFTAAYAPTSGPDAVRVDVAGEAIRLARRLRALVADLGLTEQPAIDATLALMLLHHSRRDARVADDGALVLLDEQDRTLWHQTDITEGLALLASVRPDAVPTLRLQAQIAARHATATTAADVDWAAIATDYRALEALTGSPVVRLNRAVATARAEGPEAGLRLLDGLDEVLPQSHRLPSVRAVLSEESGDLATAKLAYDIAIDRCANDAERAHLEARRAALD